MDERLGDLTARTRGRTAARYVKALATARSFNARAEDYVAGMRWTDKDAILETLKAGVGSVGTGDAGFVPTPAASDFFAYARPRTIIGRLDGLRRAPARTRLLAASGGSTGYWAGEAKVRPISAVASAGSTIEPLTVVAITVQTKELLLSSDPSSDLLLRDDLARAMVAAEDGAFADPANAGVSGDKPASVFNGATAITSNGGTDAGSIDADLRAAVEAISGSSDLEFAAWILSVKSAAYLASVRGSGGAPAYPGMTARGGTLLGLPAIASTAVPAYDSPSAATIGLVDASSVLLVDYGAGSFQVGDQATLAMTDQSESPQESAQVSMWQTDTIAIKAVARMNWSLVRSGAAAYISNVNY